MVQSILAECRARLTPDSDEEVVSLMYQTKTEEVKQLAKQVTIQKMIFAIFSKFRLARVAAGTCCDDPSGCQLVMPRND